MDVIGASSALHAAHVALPPQVLPDKYCARFVELVEEEVAHGTKGADAFKATENVIRQRSTKQMMSSAVSLDA